MITIHQRHRRTDGRTNGRTDGQTDRQTTCDRNTALCTKVHRAVKMMLVKIANRRIWQQKDRRQTDNVSAGREISKKHYRLEHIFFGAGNVSVCDPKIFYQCLVEKVKDYVRDNEAAKCNCPRQCSRLIYEPTISQATLSPAIAKLVAADSRQSVEQVTNDHCIVEVCLFVGTRITLS